MEPDTPKGKIKRRLSSSEEFQVLKLVLDKVLWIGFIVMGIGMYLSIQGDFGTGIYYLIAGAAILVIFNYFIVKEFEKLR